MGKGKRNFVDKSARTHKVNVFNLLNFHRYWHISCSTCMFFDQCVNVQHKREACQVAKKTQKLLRDFTYGHVNGFVSDDFYVLAQKSECDRLDAVIRSLCVKFKTDHNVRD